MMSDSIAGPGRSSFFSMRGRDRLRWYLIQAIGRGGGHHGRSHCGPGPGRGRGGFMGDAPFGDGGVAGPGWGRGGRGGLFGGRKFRAEDLQLVILALLAEAPAHGYELIRRLETRSNGFYTPSPGVIYPALTFLEETGLTELEPDGAGPRKPYRLTEAGRAALAQRRPEADSILAALDRIGARMQGVRDAFAGADGPGSGGPGAGGGGADRSDADTAGELSRARHTLKRALLARRHAGADELRRIAAILEGAAAAILGGGDP